MDSPLPSTTIPLRNIHPFALSLQEDPVIVECESCHRPVYQSAFSQHFNACILRKRKRMEEPVKLKSLTIQPSVPPVKEVKPVKSKPKGPIDYDRQCGVMLETGQPCARSITCKIHSVSSKRAVLGRSQPYDILYQLHQSRNSTLKKETKPSLPAKISNSVPVLENLSAEDEAIALFQAIRLHRSASIASSRFCRFSLSSAAQQFNSKDLIISLRSIFMNE